MNIANGVVKKSKKEMKNEAEETQFKLSGKYDSNK